MGRSIDLNCDMGESFGPWKMGSDAEAQKNLLPALLDLSRRIGEALDQGETAPAPAPRRRAAAAAS